MCKPARSLSLLKLHQVSQMKINGKPCNSSPPQITVFVVFASVLVVLSGEHQWDKNSNFPSLPPTLRSSLPFPPQNTALSGPGWPWLPRLRMSHFNCVFSVRSKGVCRHNKHLRFLFHFWSRKGSLGCLGLFSEPGWQILLHPLPS